LGLLDNVLEKMMGSDSKLEPVSEISEQPLDEIKIIAWVREKVEESRTNPSRVSFESQVVTNTAYLLGYDSVYFDANQRKLVPFSGRSPQKSKIHTNLILPTVQNRLSRLCKNPPRYDVRPNSNSQEDKDAARLTTKVIQSTLEKEKANEKRLDAYMWMQQAGHSFIQVCWDKTKGREMPDLDESGETKGVEYEGDIALDVVSPLEIFIDPLAKTIDEASWIIKAKVRKLTYFRDHYGERGELVKEEGPWLLSTQNLLRINNMSSKQNPGGSEQQMKNAAIELAYYEKKSKKHPNGRMIVVANGVLLEYKDLPCGEIPFVKFDDVKIGGKFYSESIVTHMRPIQDQYNRNLRKKAEFLNKGLTLKYIAAKGHGLHQESLNDTTEVLEYNPAVNGEAPKPVTPPQLPQYVYQDGDTLKQDINQVSGINEASSGQMPSATIPAIGMQLLVEQDETRIGIVTESNENSWAQVGALIAKYANRYYKLPRYLKESGQNGEYYVQEFTGQDLRNHFDVVVVRGSTLPGSKVLRRQELLNLYNQGMLGDPMDPSLRSKVLGALEFGDVQEVWEDQTVDMQQIKRSIEEIEQGIIPMVHEDDNHQMHFEHKNRLRKTQKFMQYPPDIQQIFLNDLETHKMFMAPPMMGPEMGMGPEGMPPGPPMGEEDMPVDMGNEETMMNEEMAAQNQGVPM
jgi:hypothetical protein